LPTEASYDNCFRQHVVGDGKIGNHGILVHVIEKKEQGNTKNTILSLIIQIYLFVMQ
jgi:hypothetical protein